MHFLLSRTTVLCSLFPIPQNICLIYFNQSYSCVSRSACTVVKVKISLSMFSRILFQFFNAISNVLFKSHYRSNHSPEANIHGRKSTCSKKMQIVEQVQITILRNHIGSQHLLYVHSKSLAMRK